MYTEPTVQQLFIVLVFLVVLVNGVGITGMLMGVQWCRKYGNSPTRSGPATTLPLFILLALTAYGSGYETPPINLISYLALIYLLGFMAGLVGTGMHTRNASDNHTGGRSPDTA